MPTLGEFMSAITGTPRHREAPPLLSLPAQRAILMRIFTGALPADTFKPGQFVRHRVGCGAIKNELVGKLAFVFMAHFSQLTEAQRERVMDAMDPSEKRTAYLPDCVIGVLSSHDCTFLVDCSATWILEPDPDAADVATPEEVVEAFRVLEAENAAAAQPPANAEQTAH